MLPACDVEIKKPGEKDARQKELHLPQMSENDLYQTLYRTGKEIPWSQ